MEIEIKIIPGSEAVSLVNPFYVSQSGKPVARETDLFFVAFKNSEIVGSVRFCEEENTPMLRSMVIHADHRRNRIGQCLLQTFEKYLNDNKIKNTFCLPYGHLGEFYGSIGFKIVADENTAPQFLQDRLTEYRKKPEIFMCMKRA